MLKHKPADNLLEKFANTEISLNEDVAAHEVENHQAVSQEITSEEREDDDGNPALVKRGACSEVLGTCDREFEKIFMKPSRARDQRSFMRCNTVANKKKQCSLEYISFK